MSTKLTSLSFYTQRRIREMAYLQSEIDQIVKEVKKLKKAKYPLYVYKRLNGQEYHCGVGQGRLEEMIQKKKAQQSEPVKKVV